MKTKILMFALFLVGVVPAPAALWEINTAIPDGNASGLWNQQTLSGMVGYVSDVQVTLNISGGYNGDLYAYLTHGSQTVVLLNRVGATAGNDFGYDNTGFLITLSATGNDVHSYQSSSPSYNGGGQLTGIWAPDGRAIDPLSTGAEFDAAARQNSGSPLGLFNGANPNGDWTLFIADMSGGGVSTWGNWSLGITAVPEPMNVAAALFAGFHLFRFARSKRRGVPNASAPSAGVKP